MTTTTYQVKGMHCAGCANGIKRVLERDLAVDDVDVSLEDGEVKVDYDEVLANDAHIIELLKNLGYEAEVK